MNETMFLLNDMNYYFIATFLYIISAIMYGISFFFKQKLGVAARVASISGLFIQTVGMVIRWIHFGEPIFTSLFEMMLWFGWGAVLVMVIAEIKFDYKHFGFFVLPFVVIIMGVALLMPGSAPGATMPALQSMWLIIHVAVATVSYAAFLAGFSAAIMYFIKKDINVAWFGFAASFFSAAMLAIINKAELITTQNFNVYLRGEAGPVAIDSFRSVGVVLFISFLFFLLAAVLYQVRLWRDKEKKEGCKLKLISNSIFTGGIVTMLLGMILLANNLISHERLKVSSQPAEMAFLFSCLIISLFMFLIILKYSTFRERLPGESLLDNLQYYTVTFGFPFLTLTIITGAVWANKAWGTYWGNDPKEWAAAVTWLVYAAYLHMRITKGWSGVKAAFILVIGFLAVMFTLIGITYLAPGGLHSYT